ncbi:CaiB/BaiF CoA transferase family protein [Thalassobaculum litoreum]|uniref:Crotonobetainyl-CoA:carnitine CoA-transferase CaiB n=1 Tax=Thalassobaculum litoreum DSM 18839 TaxID=1123362 RepID=A0A8G2BFT9_9PROT|nr:CaiB/BaiF CoA-transferase family protein [Thalassobaculum litoreum]SDF29467.1 Crotonobetainyl-CoA:carnitine CoA-transferase CaiB [Thalassobaculum litoreum DSM 18839]
MSALPLDGVRIFDLTRILAGPTATQLLGDLGADVIKIERPGQGDDTRKWGPPYVKGPDGEDTSESAYYLCANRSKRSITIDLASADGIALAKRLIGECDVLVENFKVGSLARLGLGYDQLKDEFPGLVYCSVTGFGQTGPYAERAGYDFLAQGMGGIMSVTGTPGVEPVKVGVGIADVMTGMYAATNILAALRHRDRTGEGQHIDVCLLDTQVAWLVNEGTNYLVSGEVPKPLGNEHPNIVPYKVFPTADGHVILACGNDRQFQGWCDVAGADELKNNPDYATNPLRLKNRVALYAAMPDYMMTKTTDEWVAALEAAKVPCGPVNTIDRAFADPQVQARGMRIDLPHPLAGEGTVPLIANPVKLSGTPVRYRYAPPTLGQHTDEVLAEILGLSEAEIAAERDKGAV